MRTNKHLFSSIAKGLIIGALLVFFHILSSSNDPHHTKLEILTVANDTAAQSQENETYSTFASYGVNVVMNIEIVREMLVLLIIVFCLNPGTAKFNFDIPIPLGRYVSILFSSLICPNAP